MNSGLHIAVFGKAPLPGQVKTRLIPLLGREGAAAAYRRMLLHALQIASTAAAGNISLWTTGQHDHPFLLECGAHFGAALQHQCEGDLGDRMADCLRRLLAEHAAVLLIGSDCPILSAQDLHSAVMMMTTAQIQMVFTPAQDGGYVLVGMRQTAAPYIGFTAFEQIDWSTDAVMPQTRARLTAYGWQKDRDWCEMPARWDVDTPDDYLRALHENLLGG